MFNGPIPDELESDPSFLLSFMGPVLVRNTKGDMHLEGAILDRGVTGLWFINVIVKEIMLQIRTTYVWD